MTLTSKSQQIPGMIPSENYCNKSKSFRTTTREINIHPSVPPVDTWLQVGPIINSGKMEAFRSYGARYIYLDEDVGVPIKYNNGY